MGDPAQQQPSRNSLRDTFVEMLFALAVAQVAIHAADILLARALDGSALSGLERGAAFSHLAVALLLIATSWVGWMRSASPGRHIQENGVFSWWFVGLLLDVILVVVYFVITRSVEVKQRGNDFVLTGLSARPEAHGLIF